MEIFQAKYSLTTKIIIGFFTGAILGVGLRLLFSQTGDVIHFINIVLEIGSGCFMNALRMLIVPMIFVSIVNGTLSINDLSALGRVGIKTAALYIITTMIAISLGIIAALIVKPGEGVDLTPTDSFSLPGNSSFQDYLINIIPKNPIEAMASGDTLQIIFFAILFGISIGISGKKSHTIKVFFESLNHVVLKLVSLVMIFSPYGIFCLITMLFIKIDVAVISNLAVYFLVVLCVLLIHGFITYSFLLKIFTGLNPIIYFKKMKEAIVFAFTTASSNATIPVSMDTVTQKLGVKNKIAAFTIPLGSTINMDGTSIMQGVATIFIAQIYNIDLSLLDFIIVIMMATLASIGAAGVPSVGLITLAMVLDKVGLPLEGIGFIIGVDRLLDMVRTAVNITGDCVTTCIVAKSENSMNETVFNNLEVGNVRPPIDFHHLNDEEQNS